MQIVKAKMSVRIEAGFTAEDIALRERMQLASWHDRYGDLPYVRKEKAGWIVFEALP